MVAFFRNPSNSQKRPKNASKRGIHKYAYVCILIHIYVRVCVCVCVCVRVDRPSSVVVTTTPAAAATAAAAPSTTQPDTSSNIPRSQQDTPVARNGRSSRFTHRAPQSAHTHARTGAHAPLLALTCDLPLAHTHTHTSTHTYAYSHTHPRRCRFAQRPVAARMGPRRAGRRLLASDQSLTREQHIPW